MTGSGVTASLTGVPDVGILTLMEMVNQARNIVSALDIPFICDAHNGYGNPINVIRTIREYERAGIAGIHIEDQVAPKRCGHFGERSEAFTREVPNSAYGMLEWTDT